MTAMLRADGPEALSPLGEVEFVNGVAAISVSLYGPARAVAGIVTTAGQFHTLLWNSFKRLTAAYSPTEKAALFHDTAARVCRLET